MKMRPADGEQMKRWRMWLGAGAVGAGVAAALLSGAAVAAADTSSDTGSTASAESAADSPRAEAARPSRGSGDTRDTARVSARDDDPPREAAEDSTGRDESDDADLEPPRDAAGDDGEDAPETVGGEDDSSAHRTAPGPRSDQSRRLTVVSDRTAAEPAAVDERAGTTDTSSPTEAIDTLAAPPVAATPAVRARPQTSLLGLVSAVLFNTLTAVERVVTGPPLVPPNSQVTVRSSRLKVADGLSVPADWYYPAGDEPPERMILLQHGFFAIGPMYSYTAAALAERTNSIVVAPTLTSNPLAVGGLWLGGNGMHRAVADLFVGEREALTASAVAAGYAERYGVDPDTARLPVQFALAGHSLGGGLVSGTAGYLADNGAAASLVGVILFDGVPRDGQLSSALRKLAAYEAATGHFVPVREIGAPWNIWNSTSHVNEELSQARPGRYVGVVLRGGVHMDAMRGGNPLIQVAAYLAAGFPQPQNPPAVIDLSVTWLDDWFEGRTDAGDRLRPGSTIVIPTPDGPARGVVIGDPNAAVPAPARQLVRAA